MSSARPSEVPDGFVPMPTRGPFTDINGPIWYLPSDGGASSKYGLFPEDCHTNALGFVHGGMVSTVLDSAMAQSVFETYRCRLVTLDLQVSFRSAVFKRRWAEIETNIVDELGSEVKVRAKLTSRNTLCAEGEATYRLFGSK